MNTSHLRLAFCFTFAFIAASTAQAQTSAQGLLLLYKHPPVNELIKATNDAQFPCELVSLDYWGEVRLTQYGKGDPKSKLLEVRSCVAKSSDVPKEKLVAALKYLEGKPDTAKALKDVYLMWVTRLEAMAPAYGESKSKNDERQEEAERALKQAQKAMELELQLGT